MCLEGERRHERLSQIVSAVMGGCPVPGCVFMALSHRDSNSTASQGYTHGNALGEFAFAGRVPGSDTDVVYTDGDIHDFTPTLGNGLTHGDVDSDPGPPDATWGTASPFREAF